MIETKFDRFDIRSNRRVRHAPIVSAALKKKGTDPSLIQEVTGLSMEEIAKL